MSTPAPVLALIPSFSRAVIDAGNAGDCKAVADVDRDGKPDLLVGGATLVWYRNPDWKKLRIAAASVEFTTDCQAADVNGDGRIDVITGDGKGADNVVWFENLGNGNWTRHAIGSHGNWVHDVEIADFDGDGRLDVLTHGHGTRLWYQDSPSSWSAIDPGAAGKTKEGIGIGDVDGDGRIDFVQGGWWFRNPGSRAEHWTAFRFASGYDGGSFTAAVGDLDGDGRPDISVSEQHGPRELAWYAAPADPRQGAWTRHLLSSDTGAHKLNIADMNGDGRPDLVVGLELAELRIYVNEGGSVPRFARTTVNYTGCHNTRVADVNGDGRSDILCANYMGHPPVELWLNKPPVPLALNRWTHIRIDDAREKLASGFPAFGLAFGDIDQDGFTDIVSGKYYYRNPGGDLTGAWRRTTFPVDADAMLVVDVDRDGQPDVIAQSLPNVYWLQPNRDGTQWVPRVVATLPPTSHRNSQGYRLAQVVLGGARPDIVFTTGEGVWYLRIPDEPMAGGWLARRIAPGTSEDMLAVGDVDGDGLVDIVGSDADSGRSVHWYRNRGTGAGDWTRHTVGDVTGWADRCELADIDRDGRLDIVVAVENGAASGATTYWFQAPPDPRNPSWTRHTLAVQGSTNSLSVADMDRSGSLEVVTGEHRGKLRVRIWTSPDGGQTWADTVVDAGKESHLGVRLVDLDGDGLLDLVSPAWDDYQELHVWRNDAARPKRSLLASLGVERFVRRLRASAARLLGD